MIRSNSEFMHSTAMWLIMFLQSGHQLFIVPLKYVLLTRAARKNCANKDKDGLCRILQIDSPHYTVYYKRNKILCWLGIMETRGWGKKGGRGGCIGLMLRGKPYFSSFRLKQSKLISSSFKLNLFSKPHAVQVCSLKVSFLLRDKLHTLCQTISDAREPATNWN